MLPVSLSHVLYICVCIMCTGAAVDYRDGYVGCMRALMVNGVQLDLRGIVERGEVTYGLSAGLFSFIHASIVIFYSPVTRY